MFCKGQSGCGIYLTCFIFIFSNKLYLSNVMFLKFLDIFQIFFNSFTFWLKMKNQIFKKNYKYIDFLIIGFYLYNFSYKLRYTPLLYLKYYGCSDFFIY